ncbi:hypothetical protein LB505_005621 [Fusarium chuoi]|nr:hypothetical protein LB505_005621 [Fusarium chuoi]
MTLKKRWNVEYGLHPHRDPIAVPFHAKGVPSDQSEWGHPDVAILFTCLAPTIHQPNTITGLRALRISPPPSKPGTRSTWMTRCSSGRFGRLCGITR